MSLPFPSSTGMLRVTTVDESNPALAVVPESVQGKLATVLVAYQSSTLSYKKLQLDAAGNLSVSSAGGGGAVVEEEMKSQTVHVA